MVFWVMTMCSVGEHQYLGQHTPIKSRAEVTFNLKFEVVCWVQPTRLHNVITQESLPLWKPRIL
jgi:hypothetical protein